MGHIGACQIEGLTSIAKVSENFLGEVVVGSDSMRQKQTNNIQGEGHKDLKDLSIEERKVLSTEERIALHLATVALKHRDNPDFDEAVCVRIMTDSSFLVPLSEFRMFSY